MRRFQVLRAQDDPNLVMIDLDFDTVDEAEAFLRAMEKIWAGPGKTVMQNPRARVVNVVGNQGAVTPHDSSVASAAVDPFSPRFSIPANRLRAFAHAWRPRY